MKLLILITIALVIPIFFVLVFVMSTVNKLTSLRKRCLETRQRIKAATAGMSATATSLPPGQVSDVQAQRDFNFAMEQYNAARARFPANLLAVLWDFREVEPLPGRPIDGSRRGPS